MIRNGVIDAQEEFAERRYRADAGRIFDLIKTEAMERYCVDIEMCRETYFKSMQELFAVVGDILVQTNPTHHRIEPWVEAKQRILQS